MMRTRGSAAVALICMLTVFWGCRRDAGPSPGDVSEGDVPTGNVVTVRGQLERQIDPRSFTMSGTAEIFSDNLVVVSRTELPVMTDDDEIEVTGVVHQVGIIEVERETGWDFNPQIEIELEEVKGFLVADQVRVLARD